MIAWPKQNVYIYQFLCQIPVSSHITSKYICLTSKGFNKTFECALVYSVTSCEFKGWKFAHGSVSESHASIMTGNYVLRKLLSKHQQNIRQNVAVKSDLKRLDTRRTVWWFSTQMNNLKQRLPSNLLAQWLVLCVLVHHFWLNLACYSSEEESHWIKMQAVFAINNAVYFAQSFINGRWFQRQTTKAWSKVRIKVHHECVLAIIVFVSA